MSKRGRGYNPKSRENLVQYQAPKKKEIEEKYTREIIEETALEEEHLDIIIPKTFFKGIDEQERFMSFLKMYANQFAKTGELETTDVVAIATLCKNHILEDRMLSSNKDEVENVMSAVERLKRENAKLNEQLAATRVQRVDPRANQDVTIMDIISAYEKGERQSMREKMQRDSEPEKMLDGKYNTTVSGLIT